MSIKLKMPELTELKPKISVIGIGGAGGNAVNNMIKAGLKGVEFVAANTDAQALSNSQANRKIQLGVKITQGLGAGSQPSVGRAAAEESIDAIEDALAGTHMVFVTAGMGGGTGTGAAPVVARQAREKGILTIGVVTKPFQFEGARRMKIAETGIQELQQYVDTLLIIPNQNLFRIANEKTTFQEAFNIADEVLHCGVRGITDLMVMPGLINLDFADVKTVMANMGKAMMGTGEAEGDNRAIEAAEAAISNPLLDETSMQGAKGVIINITGGEDLTLFEVDEAANHIRNQVDPEANIIVGSAFNENLAGKMRISVVATGIGEAVAYAPPAKPEAVTNTSGEKLGQAVHFPGMVEEKPEPSKVEIDVDEPPGDDQEVVHATTLDEDVPLDHDADSIEDAEVSDALQTTGLRVDYPDETEPEETVDDEAAKAEAAVEDAFITPEAIMPEEDEDLMQAPDPFAEADYANDPVETKEGTAGTEVKSSARSGPSLFERMTGGFKSSSAVEHKTENAGHASRQQASDDLDEDEEEDEARLVYSNGNGVDLPGLSPDDRVVPAGDEDQLEIPTFLKRSNNE